MQAKIKERNKAIKLRRQGLSYGEILEKIPVAKSSLSLWLKSVKLAKSQKQRLTEKKIASALRGSQRRKEIRIAITKKIKDSARREVGKLTKRELWLIGVALYWAEGSKEKDYRSSAYLSFSNLDFNMIRIFLKWLLKIIKLPKERILFSIYVHESHKGRVQELVDYWSNSTKFPKEKFSRIYFKKNKINTKRKNIEDTYFGLLRVRVTNSSNITRKIQGWIEGIN